jgi:hypothetical protein
MNDRMCRFGIFAPSQPAVYVPMMLKRPTSASAVTATRAGNPWSARYAGRCTPMNTT